jgi:O-antigen ligase
MHIPNKHAVTRTFLFTLLFCLAFAGTEELFAFMAIGQMLFIALVWFCYRNDAPSVIDTIKKQYPKTFYLFIGWLIAIFVSFIYVFTIETNGWQRLAAVIRQFYIVLQIAYCLSIMRFVLITHTPFMQLLFSFALGFIGMVFVHAAVLYFGPYCDSETWLKDPFLSPNMRDIGDLATAAIAIFGVMFWLNTHKTHSAMLFGLFTISWAYLLWSGGRTAIASALLVNVLTLVVLRFYAQLAWQKIALSGLALIVAYLLCMQLSIYDWNGVVRYSGEWQQSNSGDMTNGRLDMWLWSIDAIMRKLWIGHGPYSFYFLAERFEHQFWHDHPHNLVIQSLIEWGAIGTTLLLGLLLALAIIGIKQLKSRAIAKDGDFLAAASVVLMLTLGSLTGGSYWDYQPVIILVTAFALFPALKTLR